MRTLLKHAEKTLRPDVLLLVRGVYGSGGDVEVRPGLTGIVTNIRPPPGTINWTDADCSVVAVRLKALRDYLARVNA